RDAEREQREQHPGDRRAARGALRRPRDLVASLMARGSSPAALAVARGLSLAVRAGDHPPPFFVSPRLVASGTDQFRRGLQIFGCDKPFRRALARINSNV